MPNINEIKSAIDIKDIDVEEIFNSMPQIRPFVIRKGIRYDLCYEENEWKWIMEGNEEIFLPAINPQASILVGGSSDASDSKVKLEYYGGLDNYLLYQTSKLSFNTSLNLNDEYEWEGEVYGNLWENANKNRFLSTYNSVKKIFEIYKKLLKDHKNRQRLAGYQGQ